MIESTAEAMGEHVLLGKPTDADKLARVRAYCTERITMMADLRRSAGNAGFVALPQRYWARQLEVEAVLAILDEVSP